MVIGKLWKDILSPVVNEEVVVAPQTTPSLDACQGSTMLEDSNGRG